MVAPSVALVRVTVVPAATAEPEATLAFTFATGVLDAASFWF